MAEGQVTNPNDAPHFSVLAQYVKDLSFEAPNSPAILRQQGNAPQIAMNVSVNVDALSEDNYNVTILFTAKAGEGKDMLFNLELTYGAVFLMRNIPQEHMTLLLNAECPRLLFPYARQIISDVTRNGGFPPLMVDPIDFNALYQQRLAHEAAKNGQPN